MKKASSMPGGAFKYKGKKKLEIVYIVKELTKRRGQGEKHCKGTGRKEGARREKERESKTSISSRNGSAL
jgi:hypothetical protein